METTKKLSIFLSIFASLLIVFVFHAENAAAATIYYVAKTGSDSNSCTQAQNAAIPKLTIGAALGCVGMTSGAGADATVVVEAGTYNEALIRNIPSGTSWSRPFRLMASSGDIVTIKPNSGLHVIRTEGPTQYAIIEGFILDGANTTNMGIKITYGTATGISSYVELRNNEIINSKLSAIFIDGTSLGNRIIGNKIHANGTTPNLDHGMYVTSDDNMIERNEIYLNCAFGVTLYHGNSSAQPDNNVIRYNTIHDNDTCNTSSSHIGINGGTNNAAHSNIVYGKGRGVTIKFAYTPPISNTQILNNTFYNTTAPCIDVGSQSTNAIVQNNICYQAGQIVNRGSGTLLGNNLVDTDPKFINAASADFRLQANSPAIDAGIAISQATIDFAGVSRPQGKAYDIGAYEFLGQVTPPLEEVRERKTTSDTPPQVEPPESRPILQRIWKWFISLFGF